SAYTYTYDAGGRQAMVTADVAPGQLGGSFTLTSVNNKGGLRTSLAATRNGVDDFTNTYQIDSLGRLASIQQSGTGWAPVASKRVDFSFDGLGRSSGLTRYSDLAGTALIATTTEGYDASGRVSDIIHSVGATTLAHYHYSYNAAGLISQVDSPDGTVVNTYDSDGQLTSAQGPGAAAATYTPDSNGNRTDPGYQTGPNNQLLSDGTYTYTYDFEGNRTSRTSIATGTVILYNWDYRNRLTRVVTEDSAGQVTAEDDYTYDVENRRIAVATGIPGSDPTVTRYIYDGDHPVLALSESGQVEHRYLFGPAVDQVLADEDASGHILWSLADIQETIRDLVDSGGAVQDHIVYDPFGRVTAETAPAVGATFAFGYTGQAYDRDTGLSYYKARYYDAAPGRFLSEDPLGFGGGDLNLTRYVGNDPANATDPSGKEMFSDITIAQALNAGLAAYNAYSGGLNAYQGVQDLSQAFQELESNHPYTGAAYLLRSITNFGLAGFDFFNAYSIFKGPTPPFFGTAEAQLIGGGTRQITVLLATQSQFITQFVVPALGNLFALSEIANPGGGGLDGGGGSSSSGEVKAQSNWNGSFPTGSTPDPVLPNLPKFNPTPGKRVTFGKLSTQYGEVLMKSGDNRVRAWFDDFFQRIYLGRALSRG
ncbi:MAG: RHS repeat-associated core domain-containing protein, partial [Isosphaeraceae bacterium]